MQSLYYFTGRSVTKRELSSPATVKLKPMSAEAVVLIVTLPQQSKIVNRFDITSPRAAKHAAPHSTVVACSLVLSICAKQTVSHAVGVSTLPVGVETYVNCSATASECSTDRDHITTGPRRWRRSFVRSQAQAAACSQLSILKRPVLCCRKRSITCCQANQLRRFVDSQTLVTFEPRDDLRPVNCELLVGVKGCRASYLIHNPNSTSHHITSPSESQIEAAH